MTRLSEEGRQALAGIAERYGVSQEAVEHLLMAVIAGGTTQAQFNHPEFGGMGQWSQGGMTMVGDMFNNGLKAKVADICADLATLARGAAFTAPPASYQSQSQGSGSNVSLFVPGSFSQGSAWPEGLGHASSSGAQNNLRYAFFPASRRLAIDIDGRITVYDTGDHQIGGFSQQQSGDQSLSFTSQYGLVRVSDLAIVPQPQDRHEPTPAAAPAETRTGSEPLHSPASQPSVPPQATSVSPPLSPEPAAQTRAAQSDDEIFAKIERLAGLHAKGILTDKEFEAKKVDLLDRL